MGILILIYYILCIYFYVSKVYWTVLDISNLNKCIIISILLVAPIYLLDVYVY